jgi:Flp pilus assembly protein TadD
MAELTIDQALHLAIRYHSAGNLVDAEKIYQQILRALPHHAEAAHLLGVLSGQRGDFITAIDLLNRAVTLNPQNPQYYKNLGKALHDSGRIDEGIVATRKAVEMMSNDPAAHNDFGVMVMEAGGLDEAIAAFRAAVAIQPASPVFVGNLAHCLHDRGLLQEAAAMYRRAIELAPDNMQFHFGYSMTLLSLGEFEAGWEEFESRFAIPSLKVTRHFTEPQWDGSDLNGKTILLHTEGGFGDGLQFIRFLPMVRRRAAIVLLECQPELVNLFSQLPGVERLVARGQPLPKFDVQIPLQGLPRIFRTTLQTIPTRVPYLAAPSQQATKWRDRVAAQPGLKVGIVWAGSSGGNRLRRPHTLQTFLPLAQVKGVQFFSLQKGAHAQQAIPPGFPLMDWTAEISDFADLAGLISSLDLVISIETSVAHLAGAMAKPIWTLIPFISDFRWMRDGNDSPWYPTMRLYRHTYDGNWSDVMEKIAGDLASFRDSLRR